MLYFAYGSNMDFGQMRERCPSAQFVAVAELPKHRLAFTRESKERKCGVADVVGDEKGSVWGVVYDIPEVEFGRLDQGEGYRLGREPMENSYVREPRHVNRGGDKSTPLLVWIYVANRQPNPPFPNAVYKKQIVDGAKFWHLPDKYIAKLERIETKA